MANILFLTSSPDGLCPVGESANRGVAPVSEKNRLRFRLTAAWPEEPATIVAFSSDPDDDAMNDDMAGFYKEMFEASDLAVNEVYVVDHRSMDYADAWLKAADVVILSGGHVPTENRFFTEINLKEKLREYYGIIIGISAGTMNSADVVYAQPELEGEAADPDYVKFFPGLDLTKVNILPHYEGVKDEILDGMKLFEDITYGDSYGHVFYALEDGGYLYGDEEGSQFLCGIVREISDGKMRVICEDGEEIPVT